MNSPKTKYLAFPYIVWMIGFTVIPLALIVYYAILTWSGYELATRARQAVSTMPQFTMGQVYMIFPVAGVLCIVGAVINLLVTLTVKEEGKEEKA